MTWNQWRNEEVHIIPIEEPEDSPEMTEDKEEVKRKKKTTDKASKKRIESTKSDHMPDLEETETRDHSPAESPGEQEPVSSSEKSLTGELEEKIARLLAERDEWKNRTLRTAAEFENFRRRSEKEKSDWIRNANQRLVLEICDVMDNFERALESKPESEEYAAFVRGVEMIRDQVQGILQREGVKKIEALGKDFDPMFHEALAQVPSELEVHRIVSVIQNGYMMNDKIIRPARVAVSNGEPPVKKDSESE